MIIPKHHTSCAAAALASAVLCLLLAAPACEDDLCASQAPALEVTVKLDTALVSTKANIKSLKAEIKAGMFSRDMIFNLGDELQGTVHLFWHS